MNNNEFDNLIKSASEKLGSSPESLRKTIEKKDLNALSSILTKSDKEKLRRVLADKELMKQLKSAGSPEEVLKLLGSMTDEVLGKRGDFNALLEAYQQMAKDKGFDIFKPDEGASQSGRSGAYTAMSQEQGTKLEGLFTSLQDHASGIHQLLEELKEGRYADHEIFVQIAENTAYCKLLEDILEIITRQERDGVKIKG